MAGTPRPTSGSTRITSKQAALKVPTEAKAVA